MPVDPLSIWKQELENMPEIITPWAFNKANWYAQRITGIQPDPSALTAPGFTFIFNMSAFAAGLSSLAPNPAQPAAILGFAAAWEMAILASVAIVLPGAVVGSPSPATTFSVVIATIINPASIAVGKAKLMELATSPGGLSSSESKFPEKFRDATLQLKIDVTGIDSTPPPAGPLPLVAMNIPLI